MSHQPIRRLMPLATLLFLLLSRSALAQGGARVIATARASADPVALTLVDSDQRGVTLSAEVTKTVHDQFAATDWVFFDNNTMSISKNGQLFLPVVYLTNSELTFFLLHTRDKESKRTFDALVSRDPANPLQGSAMVLYTISSGQPESVATVWLNIPPELHAVGGGVRGEGRPRKEHAAAQGPPWAAAAASTGRPLAPRLPRALHVLRDHASIADQDRRPGGVVAQSRTEPLASAPADTSEERR